jgi:hypothetical protein
VLLDQPGHAQPAAAIAARAGDIEMRDLGPEIGKRVLGLSYVPPRLARPGDAADQGFEKDRPAGVHRISALAGFHFDELGGNRQAP